jgi:hypothetical protein
MSFACILIWTMGSPFTLSAVDGLEMRGTMRRHDEDGLYREESGSRRLGD